MKLAELTLVPCMGGLTVWLRLHPIWTISFLSASKLYYRVWLDQNLELKTRDGGQSYAFHQKLHQQNADIETSSGAPYKRLSTTMATRRSQCYLCLQIWVPVGCIESAGCCPTEEVPSVVFLGEQRFARQHKTNHSRIRIRFSWISLHLIDSWMNESHFQH